MTTQTEKSYHKIFIKDINPYSNQQLERTIYLLGSPGAGKTRFMKRLMDETKGTLVIESGIFDLFQKHVADFVRRKRESGCQDRLTDFFVRDDSARLGYRRDQDFRLPEIDGLEIWNCLMSSIPLDKTLDEVANDRLFTKGEGADAVCRNLPYIGWGAYHYRESLGDRIISGGKSGFPDWLFIPEENGKYIQVISFPGHHKITDFTSNQSIPKIPTPTSAVFLVDPNINQFETKRDDSYGNPVIGRVHIHLAEALMLERKGVKVRWILSKTSMEQLDEKRRKAIKHYSPKDYKPSLRDIARRVPNLSGFDSYTSSREEILQVLK